MDDPSVRSAFHGCAKEFFDSVLSYRTRQQQAFLLAAVYVTENVIGCRYFVSLSP